MRPKKVILTIGQNPTRERMLRFLLWSRGYEVFALHPETELIIGSFHTIDMVICDADLNAMGGNDLVSSLKSTAPDIPMILISRVLEEWPGNCAADAFLAKNDDTAQFLGAVKVLISRKRGPKAQPSLTPAEVPA